MTQEDFVRWFLVSRKTHCKDLPRSKWPSGPTNPYDQAVIEDYTISGSMVTNIEWAYQDDPWYLSVPKPSPHLYWHGGADQSDIRFSLEEEDCLRCFSSLSIKKGLYSLVNFQIRLPSGKYALSITHFLP